MKQNELKNKCDNYLNIKMQCNSKYKTFFLCIVSPQIVLIYTFFCQIFIINIIFISTSLSYLFFPSPFFHHLFLMPVDYTRNRHNSVENKHYR